MAPRDSQGGSASLDHVPCLAVIFADIAITVHVSNIVYKINWEDKKALRVPGLESRSIGRWQSKPDLEALVAPPCQKPVSMCIKLTWRTLSNQ